MAPDTDEQMRLLFISNAAEHAVLLRQLMEQHGLSGEIRRMDPGRGAVAVARRSGPYRGEPPPDVVMLDFSRPERKTLATVRQIALAPRAPASPIVLLTSEDTDAALRSEELQFDENSVFAPITLACFLRKMKQHSRQRFLRSLAVMAELGPILVRLPEASTRPTIDETALSA